MKSPRLLVGGRTARLSAASVRMLEYCLPAEPSPPDRHPKWRPPHFEYVMDGQPSEIFRG